MALTNYGLADSALEFQYADRMADTARQPHFAGFPDPAQDLLTTFQMYAFMPEMGATHPLLRKEYNDLSDRLDMARPIGGLQALASNTLYVLPFICSAIG